MIKSVSVVGVFSQYGDKGVRIGWFDDDGYFGNLSIKQVEGNNPSETNMFIDSENMSKEFVKEVLCAMVDNSELGDNPRKFTHSFKPGDPEYKR